MKIREVMTRDVEVIEPEATLKEAAEKMRTLNVGVIPVCDGDRIQGMVTDRDLVVRGIALNQDPTSTKVSEVMSPDVTWIFEDRDVEEAGRLMREKQIRRLIVLDESKKMVGIVSLGDLAVETEDQKLGGKVLEGVSEPSTPLH